MAAPPPTRPGRILTACPPQENHVISLLLLTFLLRRRGWEVIYLGANVPSERLGTTVEATGPKLVILAAQQLHSAATLMQMAETLHQSNVMAAYGGLIFNLLPALRGRISGHFLGESLEAASQTIESLMTAPRPARRAEAVPVACRAARDHYHERQMLIEATLLRSLSSFSVVHEYVVMANRELALNIVAALSLGDMDYLGTDIAWLYGLLKNFRMPQDALTDYLAAYYQTAQEQLDDRGRPIVTWLARLVNEQALNTARGREV
jgi:hypothetical protein